MGLVEGNPGAGALISGEGELVVCETYESTGQKTGGKRTETSYHAACQGDRAAGERLAEEGQMRAGLGSVLQHHPDGADDARWCQILRIQFSLRVPNTRQRPGIFRAFQFSRMSLSTLRGGNSCASEHVYLVELPVNPASGHTHGLRRQHALRIRPR